MKIEVGISIHSLRMEGDLKPPIFISFVMTFQSTPSAWRETLYILYHTCNARYFNPLPPHGGRLSFISCVSSTIAFQSTPSAWRETRFACSTIDSRMYFNPLPPHGGRRGTFATWGKIRYFNPLPPHGGRPSFARKMPEWYEDFNPLPPHGGRPAAIMQHVDRCLFQSTPSAWRETEKVLYEYPVWKFQSTPSAWRETRLS